MKLIKVNSRQAVTNYKNDSRIEYMPAYINPLLVIYCLEMGDVIRVIFGERDYIEMDKAEFEKLQEKKDQA